MLRSNPTKDILLDLYETQKLSVDEICTILGVSSTTLATYLRRYGIQGRRTGAVSDCPDVERLRCLAADSSNSNEDIAKTFGISKNLLWNWFSRYQIERLSVRNNEGKKPDKAELERLYEEKSANQIAKDLGVSTPTIIKWLRQYGIETRSIKDSAVETWKKVRKTCLEKYGTEHACKTDEVKKIIRQANQKKFGVDYPTQSSAVRHKVKTTNLERYGVENTFALVQSPSKGELELVARLNSRGFNFQSTRSVLPDSYELDGYDDERKIAVEFCGLYWHSEPKKDRYYHAWKFQECEKLGIRLYTIFEDEWKRLPDKIIDYIYMNNRTDKMIIGARKTKIVEVPITTARQFCEVNHIQEDTPSTKKAYGLAMNDELLSVMTFGRHHRDNTQIVMNRFCSVSGVSVQGGASRLMRHAWKELDQHDIITWSDNRWSAGNVYEKMGCVLDEELLPDYSWCDFSKVVRYSKQSRKKSVTKQPMHLTEKEYNESLGFHRIWDCGKKRWIFKGVVDKEKGGELPPPLSFL